MSEFVQATIDAYASVLAITIPIAFTIGACNICFNIICSAFFNGKLHIGGRGRD